MQSLTTLPTARLTVWCWYCIHWRSPCTSAVVMWATTRKSLLMKCASLMKVSNLSLHCLSCPVLSCPVLSCPVLSCPVLSCPVLLSPPTLVLSFSYIHLLYVHISLSSLSTSSTLSVYRINQLNSTWLPRNWCFTLPLIPFPLFSFYSFPLFFLSSPLCSYFSPFLSPTLFSLISSPSLLTVFLRDEIGLCNLMFHDQ